MLHSDCSLAMHVMPLSGTESTSAEIDTPQDEHQRLAATFITTLLTPQPRRSQEPTTVPDARTWRYAHATPARTFLELGVTLPFPPFAADLAALMPLMAAQQ